jgi:hypothetical protein
VNPQIDQQTLGRFAAPLSLGSDIQGHAYWLWKSKAMAMPEKLCQSSQGCGRCGPLIRGLRYAREKYSGHRA